MGWQIIISGMALGILSSFHCVGMCGPIAFSLPLNYLPTHKKLIGILLYNFGRISTYAMMGLFFGFIGRQFFLGGLQQWFSIILGVIILILLISSLTSKSLFHLHFLENINTKLQSFIGSYIVKKQLYGMYLIGAANGLLPCGMVYFAIAGALAAGSILSGIGFMVAFGLGTLPLMMMLTYFGFMISISTRNTVKKLIPFFIATMGILLILRGMNLGIPYLSPYLNHTGSGTISCH